MSPKIQIVQELQLTTKNDTELDKVFNFVIPYYSVYNYKQGPVQNIIAERDPLRGYEGSSMAPMLDPLSSMDTVTEVRGLETSKPLSFLHLPLLDRSDPIWHSISYVVSLWQAIKTHSCGNAGRGIIITSRFGLRMPLSRQYIQVPS